MQQPMRIMIADARAAVREALRLLIDREIAYCIIEQAAEAETLLVQIGQACPWLLLLDWHLPGMRATVLLRVVRNVCTGIRIIIMSERLEDKPKALNAGANGFVLKSDPPDALIALLRALLGDTSAQG